MGYRAWIKLISVSSFLHRQRMYESLMCQLDHFVSKAASRKRKFCLDCSFTKAIFFSKNVLLIECNANHLVRNPGGASNIFRPVNLFARWVIFNFWPMTNKYTKFTQAKFHDSLPGSSLENEKLRIPWVDTYFLSLKVCAKKSYGN